MVYGECWFTGKFYFKHGGSQNATLRFHTNNCFWKNVSQMFHGGLSELRDRHHLWLIFKVIVSIADPVT